jgi:two-component system sensor histidine kinase KdpD
LASITGALSTLIEAPSEMEHTLPSTRKELIETAYDEARRLNQLVGNLLDMSRLESGSLRLSLEPCDLQDLVGIALERFGGRRADHKVNIHLAEDLPLLDLDVSLMVQALVNLLDNAAKYSPLDSPIELYAYGQAESVFIEVSDNGVGIPNEELGRIFDKFYR